MKTPIARLCATCFLVASLLAWLSGNASAELVELTIDSREPWAGGRSFGDHGSYELIRGRALFAVDPALEPNRRVVDLELAPRSARGRVEFSADIGLLAPVDPTRSNGALFYDVNNRGHPTCLGVVGGGSDHFFERHGFVVAWSGWIAELLPDGRRYVLRAPVATRDGEEITGLVRAEMCPDDDADRLSLAHWGGHGSHEPTAQGSAGARMTWRLREGDSRTPIPREQWRFEIERVEHAGESALLPRVDVVLAGGFQAGCIYEVVYEAKGPIVQGLGLAGIRDLVSFLRHESDARNPLRDGSGGSTITRTIGFGTSQSGRCLRLLLHDGFNADEHGRRVFDGLIPHVAGAGLGFFNHRFASPTRHNAQHDNHLYPADVFPFAYGDDRDPFTGRVDGLLRRARASKTVPKIFHTQSSSEYWHRSGSLVHTDASGQRDAEIPPEVRVYTFGGAQHGPGNGRVGARGRGQLPSNPTDYRPLLRALVVALDGWIRDGTEPPPGVHPRIADGTLVGWREIESGWRALPGVRYPTVIQTPEHLDRGPWFESQRRATIEPPVRLGRYTVKVPALDADNNERGTLRVPAVAVPLATFTSWNLRHRSIGAETELLSLQGGYIPLPADREARHASGDPRLSIAERYADFEDYLDRYRAVVRDLVSRRLVLEEDVAGLEELARSHRALFR